MKTRTAPALALLSAMCAAAVGVGFALATVDAQQHYKAPRTPWGDPDIQGNYTNLTEAGTPFERPKELEGRNLSEISGEELRAIKRQAAERTVNAFLGPTEAPDNWWQIAYRQIENGAQAWLVVDPPDGRIPPLTPEAQRKQQAAAEARKRNTRGPADSYTDRSLYDRCITRGFPNSGMPSIYGNSSHITQGPGFVAITYEMIHDTRVIRLTTAPHVGKGIRTDFGDSRGHWEGETLVVETTNFLDRSVYRNANADRLKVVERFTMTGPKTLQWNVTIDDPTTWTRPWTFSLPFTLNPAEPMQLYECHEGNYGLPNILSAARAEERAKAADAK
jgi:hypothetical protein